MILVAGIGNIFLGDDAFGSEVARRFAQRPALANVRIADFGIRGIDFAYALLDRYEAVFILDAVERGGIPGTIYVMEPDLDALSETAAGIEAHAMDPMRVLVLARSMGADIRNIRIVGCEPETLRPPDDGRMGLSPPVAAAVDQAIEILDSLIQEAQVQT